METNPGMDSENFAGLAGVVEKLKELLGDRVAISWEAPIKRFSALLGSGRTLRRIRQSTDKEQLQDTLAEIHYALLFDKLGFRVEIEPCGAKGPDLGVSRDGESAFVEVTRFRRIFPGPPCFQPGQDMVSEYGNVRRDVRKVIEKTTAKFRQLGNRNSVVAIWNDDEDMEELEVGIATSEMVEETAKGIFSLPVGLAFILYGSTWIDGRGKRYHCFEASRSISPIMRSWLRELESLKQGL